MKKILTTLSSLILLACSPAPACAQVSAMITDTRTSVEAFTKDGRADLYAFYDRAHEGPDYVEIQPRYRVHGRWSIATAIELPEDRDTRYLLGAGYTRQGLKINAYRRDDTAQAGHSYQVTIVAQKSVDLVHVRGFVDMATREGARDSFAFGRASITYGKELRAGFEYQGSSERPDEMSVVIRWVP